MTCRLNITPGPSQRGSFRRALGIGCASLIFFSSNPASAKPLVQDLAENLHYIRTHILPNDLSAAELKTGAVILDLRFALAEVGALSALDAWIRVQATSSTPVIVLINPDTAPALRESLAAHHRRSGLITIGRPTSEIVPDIAIESSAEEERRAYEALEKDSSIESLITENADKPRIDEAAIMRARANPDGEPVDTDFPEPPTSSAKTEDAPPPPPVDRALQRAIHLHRALLALKRL